MTICRFIVVLVTAAIGSPNVAAQDLERQFLGHANAVWCVSIAPDGKTLASASLDGTVKIWDAATGQVLHTQHHGKEVIFVAFSPDGKWMLTRDCESTVKLWDATTFKIQKTYERNFRQGEHSFEHVFFANGSRPLGLHYTTYSWRLHALEDGKALARLIEGKQPLPTNISEASIAADGKLMALATGESDILMWNVSDKDSQQKLSDHAKRVTALAFSRDGSTLASADEGGRVLLWNVASSEKRRELTFKHEIWCVAFSPDSKTLALVGKTNDVYLFDVLTGQQRAVLKGHRSRINCVTFSRDGKLLATGSWDRTARIWAIPP